MAYVSPNFKSKKALREAVAGGKEVTVFSPSPFPCQQDGKIAVEGPWSPEPHRFYSTVLVANGKVVKVLGLKFPRTFETVEKRNILEGLQ